MTVGERAVRRRVLLHPPPPPCAQTNGRGIALTAAPRSQYILAGRGAGYASGPTAPHSPQECDGLGSPLRQTPLLLPVTGHHRRAPEGEVKQSVERSDATRVAGQPRQPAGRTTGRRRLGPARGGRRPIKGRTPRGRRKAPAVGRPPPSTPTVTCAGHSTWRKPSNYPIEACVVQFESNTHK